MKAMIVRRFGDSGVFETADIPKPELKPGHVIVRIAATSVNPVDTMIREMGPELPISPQPPAVLGMDFSGTVESVGDGVENFSVGDEVYGCAGGLMALPGALAEYMLADARLIAHKPANLGMRDAAAIPLVGITAWEGLTRAQVGSGQNVLVHGGSGGVGHLAIQLARHFGADVFSTGGGESQLSMIESLGATGINYKSESVADYADRCTSGAGFDAVFDTIGGENLLNSFEAAKLNGQISTTVSLAAIDLSGAHFKGLSLHVVFMLIPMIYDLGREDHGKILREIAAVADAGGLRPVVDDKRFSLDEIGHAHDHLASGNARGKIVVDL
ncbi:MAG: zinc-dependent alcohol dehydrogenase family protein [Pseudomonadota bacterium]